MFKRTITILFIIIMLSSLLIGCGKKVDLKQIAQEAIQKQADINSYTFKGNAVVRLGNALSPEGTDPVTSMLLTMFMDSAIEWEGVASVDPVQLEVNLKLTPTNSTQAFNLPIIIKDNKLYISMPLINQPDESFVIDLDQLSSLSGQANPLSSKSLQNTGDLSVLLFNQVLESLDLKLFKQKDELISAEISNKQAHAFIESFFKNLPHLLLELNAGGFILQDQSEQITKSIAENHKRIVDSFAIPTSDPGHFSLKIDEQGFIREQMFKLHFSINTPDGQINNHKIEFMNTMDHINVQPTFSMELPKKQIPIEQLLKLLPVAQ